MKFSKAFVITLTAVFIVICGITVAYFVTENNRIKTEAEAKAQEANRKLEAEQQRVADEQRKRELAQQKQREIEEQARKEEQQAQIEKDTQRELAEYVAPIEKKLSEIAGAYMTDGYRQIGEHYIDGLSEGKIKVYPDITFQGGRDYVLVSTCDRDCSDIDIAIFDEKGNEVVEDVESDPVPIISFTATRTSQAEIRVRMHKCDSSSGCYFGISLLGKQ